MEGGTEAIPSLRCASLGTRKAHVTRNLYRRLEHLEELRTPEEEPRTWQVIYVDSDGTRELGPVIRVPMPNRWAEPWQETKWK